jgi:hypothetical protein
MKNINDEFGQGVEVVEEKYTQPSISPFSFINAINYTKEDLIVDDWSEKQYQPYIVNKGLSFAPDTVIAANEMNSRPHLDRKLQFNFLINIVRQRKRFSKWIKPEKIEDLEIVKNYYGYSTEKARNALSILTKQQLDTLKQKLQKGGMNDK